MAWSRSKKLIKCKERPIAFIDMGPRPPEVEPPAPGRRIADREGHCNKPIHPSPSGRGAGGEGVPLIFLHGLFQTAEAWGDHLDFFAQTARVIAPDQRGHGESCRPKTGYAPEDYVEDLLCVVRECSLTSVDLIGFSLGGRHALLFAAWHPQYVRRAVVVDMGVEKHSRYPRHFEEFFRKHPGPFANREAVDTIIQQERKSGNRVPVPMGDLQEVLVQRGTHFEWNFYWPGMVETLVKGRSKDYFEDLSRIAASTLLIRGQRTRIVPEAVFEKMASVIPVCQAKVVEGADHFVYRSQPTIFRELVHSFLHENPLAM